MKDAATEEPQGGRTVRRSVSTLQQLDEEIESSSPGSGGSMRSLSKGKITNLMSKNFMERTTSIRGLEALVNEHEQTEPDGL